MDQESNKEKESIAIIGGGPAAMSLACHLDSSRFDIAIYERNKTIGRKFLVAGKGGFNLSHGEDLETLISRYEPASFLEPALRHFDNTALRKWLAGLGIPTYVGSSNRVFPQRGIKPIEVLNAIKQQLHDNQVNIHTEHEWIGWTDSDALLFSNNKTIKADYIVFALGGGSWGITGSDGSWQEVFKKKGLVTVPFVASNCAFMVQWSDSFRTTYAGKPLKNIAVSFKGKTQKGELVITEEGLEGNSIYALSSSLQTYLKEQGKAEISLDLKPTIELPRLKEKYASAKATNPSTILRDQLHLTKPQLALIKSILTKEQFLDKDTLLSFIKNLPLTLTGSAPIDKAISTMGGLSLTSVDSQYQLKSSDKIYCIGEMLAWNAPTGGYLLQGCLAMGVYLACCINTKYKL